MASSRPPRFGQGSQSGVLGRKESPRLSKWGSLRRSFLHWCHGHGVLSVLRESRSCYYRIWQGWKQKQTLALDKVRLSVPVLPTFDVDGNRTDRHSYILGIRALERERPWLTLGDSELFLQGWFPAERCVLGNLGIEGDNAGFVAKESPTETNICSIG